MGEHAGVFWEEFALTPLAKKRPEQLCCFIRCNPWIYLWPVMYRRLLEQPRAIRHRSAFGVIRTVIEPRYSRVGDGSSAHRAGFEGYPQVAAHKPVISQKRRRFAHCDDFGVRGRVVASERAVGTSADDLAIFDDYRAHRDFACRRSAPRQHKRFFHHFAGFA